MDQIELIDKRKPREKHFLQKDGTIRAEIYDTDIHYLKDGKYEEIDNTLVKKNDSLVNVSNDYQVEFKEDYKESLMKMSKDNHFIDFKIRDTKDTKLKSDKRKISKQMKNVTYNDIADDITIEYQTLSNKVKETIVLQNANHSELSFELDTNLKLKDENGEILALDDNEKVVFRIEKPFMVDANGIRNDNVHYYIKEYDDGYTLNLVLDDEWLINKEREFPVYVDPTISTQNDEITLYDTYIYSGDTNDIRYNKAYMKAGIENKNGTSVRNMALVKFSLPQLGTGSEIIEAGLDIIPYPQENNNASSRNYLLEAHQITCTWEEETANWNNMYNQYNDRVEAITTFERSHIENSILNYTYIGFDLTNLVKKWYKDTPNYGVMITSCESEYIDNDYPIFFSKDNSVNGNPKPLAYIVYRNINGIESYFDYKIQNYSDGKTYVNTYNGNLTSIFNLLSTSGEKSPVSVSLTYNSNDVVLSNQTFFGLGYKLNYEQWLEIIETTKIKYIDEDGTIHYFNREYDYVNNVEGNTFIDEDGLGLKIEIDSNKYIMVDINGNKKEFNNISNDLNKYSLTKIVDNDNSEVNILYNSDESIKKIIDGASNEITINYVGNNVTLSYSTYNTILQFNNNKLLSISSVHGTTNFYYNEYSLIESIVDITGVKIGFEYYNCSPYKIKKIVEYDINNDIQRYYLLSYSLSTTTITNDLGRVEILQYNDMGNLISKNNLSSIDELSSAYSLERRYGDGSTVNKINSKMVPYKYIKNYLKNTSFETNEYYFTADQDLTQEFDTSNYKSGIRCLKISSIINEKSIFKEISLPKGNYYTFSGYFKNTSKVKISLSYLDQNNDLKVESEIFENNINFEREDVTILYDENASSDLKIQITLYESGTAYIDDIQLEKGEVANYYNMIENSDFSEGILDWTIDIGEENSTYNVNDFINVVNINNQNDKALKVSMNPLINTSFSKKFDIKGNEGDMFTISFWYKNEGVTPYAPYTGSNITIFYEPYNDENGHCILMVPLPSTGNSWQHYVYRESALEDFKSIRIVFNQVGQANDFYITDLSFYNEVTSGHYNYDENGNLISYSDENGNVDSIEYNDDNQIVKLTNSLNNTQRFEYDVEKKDKIITAFYNDKCNRITYNADGNIIRTKESSKHVDNITNGIYKIRKKGTNKYIKAELNTILLEENDCSNTIWKFHQNNNQFQLIYNVEEEYSISKSNSTPILSDESFVLFDVIKNSDESYQIRYTENNEVKVLKADDNVLTFENYEGNNPAYDFFIETPEVTFIENDIEYTQDGNFIKNKMDSCFKKTTYSVNPITGLVSSITNPNNITKYFQYNNNNKLSQITYDNKNILFTYNSNKKLNSINQGNKTYILLYDNMLRNTGVKLGENINFFNTIFDTYGNPIKTTYSTGDIIEFEYDSFDRISKIKKMNNQYNYKYDNNGNVCKIISNDDISRFYYDINSRLYKYKNSNFMSDSEYDSNDNLIKRTYNLSNHNNNMVITYNQYENPNTVSLDNDIINYSYDSLNRVNQRKINNILTNNYSYIGAGKRTSNIICEHIINNEKYDYIYDDMYNITEIYINNTLKKQYEYDNMNELVKEINYDNQNQIIYIYDDSGNLQKVTTKDINTNLTIDEKIYTYSNDWEDQLVQYDNKQIEYDSFGNMKKYGTASLQWINGKELSNYTDLPKNLSIEYKYNANGIRISKVVNNVETKYYVLNDKIIYEERNNIPIYYLYDVDDIIGMEYNNQRYYYIKNIKNDIVGIIDSNGNKIVSYEYDSWGNIINILDQNNNEITSSNNIGIINPFRYRGYYYDNETEMYYLNSRYYNPTLKRFISPDIVLGINNEILDYNLYLYVNNNPINYTDSCGRGFLSFVSSVASTIGNAIGKAVSGIVNKNNKKSTKAKTKTKVKDLIKTVVNSKKTFVAEYNTGFGIGDNMQVGPIGDGQLIKKSFGQGYEKEMFSDNQGKSYIFVNEEVSASKGIVGVKAGMKNNDPTMNPMAFMWEYFFSDDTNYYIEMGAFGDKSHFGTSADTNRTVFIGVDFDWYCLVGGGFKIGVNIEV